MTIPLAITAIFALLLWLRTYRQLQAALLRDVLRRIAARRVARYCRETADTLDVSIDAGVDLATVTRMQIAARDAAIDALTTRVADLLRAPEPAS